MTQEVSSRQKGIVADGDRQVVVWDAAMRKKARVFYMVFVPLVAVFSILNLASGYMVVGVVEALAGIMGAMAFLARKKLTTQVFLHAGVACVSMVVFFFLFFPTVGQNAYVWVIALPFFTSYLVGSRGAMYWSAGFLSLALLVGGVMYARGGELYWGWNIVPYVVLPYVVSAVFAVAFARYAEKYVDDLRQAQMRSERMARALEESEAKYRTLLQSSMNAVGVHVDGKWVYANPACLRVLAADSLDALVGRSVLDVVAPDYHDLVLARIQDMRKTKKAVPMVEEKLVRLNGEVFPAEVGAAPIVFEGRQAYMLTIRDLSEIKAYEAEQKALQAQLEHAQRLESLGVLAGGIAHDFNNLLTVIMGNADMLRYSMEHSLETQAYISRIDESCDHAANLCRQMLAYAGKGSYAVEAISLNDLVRSMSALMRASVGKGVRLETQLDDCLPAIRADVSQIRQVVLNFIVNAADAIGGDQGWIRLRTYVQKLDQDDLLHLFYSADMCPGSYVVLEVADSGCGIPEDMKEKIFDPFVSTKDKGSGLGLSAVLGIVRAHHGGLDLRSKEGEGTVFRVFFPGLGRQDGGIVEQEDGDVVDAWRGDGCVLLVDDDDTVREVLGAMLQRMGFDVLTGEDGHAGLELFRRQHRKLVAVLLDMTMPGINGRDVLLGMRGMNPEVPVVMISGYSEASLDDLDEADCPDAFMQKPLQFDEVKKVLYQVLKKS